ncbi:MAG TPA: energy transducer TonB [Anaeromyxobacteraceae bacterium]|nr:energy transducer TonB [Anaeromyxobacteraceae bacterium]
MRFVCDKCGRAYAVAGELSGRAFKMKCRACGHTIAVQGEGSALPVPDENPFLVAPVRATRVPGASRPAAAPIPDAPPAQAVAGPAPDRLAARATPGPASPPLQETAPGGASTGGATVHVLPQVAGDCGVPPRAKLALAVNDTFDDLRADLEEPRPRPVQSPARREAAAPLPPLAPSPPRRHVVPLVAAVLVGVVLGAAFVGAIFLRDRPSPPSWHPVEPVASAPTPLPAPQPTPPAVDPRPAEAPAAVAAAVVQAAPADAPAERAPRARKRAAPAGVERAARQKDATRVDPAEVAAGAGPGAAAARLALAPAEPKVEQPQESALPPAVVATAAAPAAPPEDEARRTGSRFQAPHLADRHCIAENLNLPEGIDGPVTVRLSVGPTGAVSQVQVLGQVKSARVENAIRQAVAGCTWVPGVDAEGKPTSLWVVQPLRFAQ